MPKFHVPVTFFCDQPTEEAAISEVRSYLWPTKGSFETHTEAVNVQSQRDQLAGRLATLIGLRDQAYELGTHAREEKNWENTNYYDNQVRILNERIEEVEGIIRDVFGLDLTAIVMQAYRLVGVEMKQEAK